MIQNFYNRKREMEFLERKYREPGPQLLVLYGRRRIGKTELLKRFLIGKKGSYILCTKDRISENIGQMKGKFHQLTGKDYFLRIETESFFDLFRYLADEAKGGKYVIIIDEFPYLIEMQKGVVSVFQKIWDELLRDTGIFLVLCGSSVGMMETEVLDFKSPLYGRRTGEWKVGQFRFSDLKEMFPKLPAHDLVEIWSVFGNVPFYLGQVDASKPVESNIREKVLTKGEILYTEPRVLLKEEFREPGIYSLALKYISLGYNTLGKLSSVTGIEKGNLSKYISVMEETHLIEYVLPLGQRKRGIYAIRDPFFNFWFRFVFTNLPDLEMGQVGDVARRIRLQLNSYFGRMFESLVMELLRERSIKMPFRYSKAAKWWHKDKEIDVIVLDDNARHVAFCECKWQDNVDAGKSISGLKEKGRHVRLPAGKRKEYYAVFAKSFRPGKIEEKNALLFSLKDICT